MRDENGEIREKRGDTLVKTLRKTYGDDFAKGYRSDARLDTVLKREGVETLDQLLKKKIVAPLLVDTHFTFNLIDNAIRLRGISTSTTRTDTICPTFTSS